MNGESRRFYEIGKEVSKGFAEGIKDIKQVDIEKHIAITEIKNILCTMPCDICSMYGKDCINEHIARRLANAGFRKASEVAEEIDDLRRYIILNENIAMKCKSNCTGHEEEYWRGKLSAFLQIRGYLDTELKKKYTEGEG